MLRARSASQALRVVLGARRTPRRANSTASYLLDDEDGWDFEEDNPPLPSTSAGEQIRSHRLPRPAHPMIHYTRDDALLGRAVYYLRASETIGSPANALSIVRAVESQFGRISEFRFSKDAELSNRFALIGHVVFCDPTSLDRLPIDRPAVINVRVPQPSFHEPLGGHGLDSLIPWLNPVDFGAPADNIDERTEKEIELVRETDIRKRQKEKRVSRIQEDSKVQEAQEAPEDRDPTERTLTIQLVPSRMTISPGNVGPTSMASLRELGRAFVEWGGFHPLSPIPNTVDLRRKALAIAGAESATQNFERSSSNDNAAEDERLEKVDQLRMRVALRGLCSSLRLRNPYESGGSSVQDPYVWDAKPPAPQIRRRLPHSSTQVSSSNNPFSANTTPDSSSGSPSSATTTSAPSRKEAPRTPPARSGFAPKLKVSLPGPSKVLESVKITSTAAQDTPESKARLKFVKESEEVEVARKQAEDARKQTAEAAKLEQQLEEHKEKEAKAKEIAQGLMFEGLVGGLKLRDTKPRLDKATEVQAKKKAKGSSAPPQRQPQARLSKIKPPQVKVETKVAPKQEKTNETPPQKQQDTGVGSRLRTFVGGWF